MHRINIHRSIRKLRRGLGSRSRCFHHGNRDVLCVRRSGGSIRAKLELAKIFTQFGKKLLEYKLKVLN